MNPFFQQPNENPLTCHVFCLDNVPANSYYSVSPFAQKVRNLCWMLKSTGNHVTYYGYESCEVECDEKVIIASEDLLFQAYPHIHSGKGHIDLNKERENPKGIEYLEKKWTLATGFEFRKRYKPGDFVFWMLPGCGQRHLYYELEAENLPVRHIEAGIGYIGACLPYKVFVSSFIRDFHYGIYQSNKRWYETLDEASKEIKRGPHYLYTYIDAEQPPTHDALIPIPFDLSQFDFRIQKEDYLLYLARILTGKGIREAVEIAERMNMKLVVAGPGDFQDQVGRKPSKNIEILGPVGPKERRDLLSRAKAVLSLSAVFETFGQAAVEALLSGTVPITANSGGFLDTIQSGYNGYRIRYSNIEAGIHAVENLDKIDPFALRDSGLRYSREWIALQYNEYLQYIDHKFKDNNEKPFFEQDWSDRQKEIQWPEQWIVPVDQKNNGGKNVP